METALLVLLLVGAVALYWQSALRARERATAAAMDLCKRQGVQFLDGTVALKRLRLQRGPNGRVQWLRDYRFEYSHVGLSRRTGLVRMQGRLLAYAGLENFREIAPATDP